MFSRSRSSEDFTAPLTPTSHDLELKLTAARVAHTGELMPISNLYLFPDQDVTVSRMTKLQRTKAPYTPTPVLPHVQQALEFFSADYVHVKYPYSEYRRALRPPQPSRVQYFDSDVKKIEEGTAQESLVELYGNFDGKAPMVLDNEALHRDTASTEVARKLRRAVDGDVLSLCYPHYEHMISSGYGATPNGGPFEDPRESFFAVNCREFRLGLGLLEPFFCSLALHNVKTGKKLSESFVVDMNANHILNILTPTLGTDALRTARTALFSLTHSERTTDVYLILRIDKVIQTKPDDASDVYTRTDAKDEKTLTKIRESIKAGCAENCQRLGQYWQSFAWAALPLFDDREDLILEERSVFNPLYRMKNDMTENDIIEQIREHIADPRTKKKGATVTGEFVIGITEIQMENLDPSAPYIYDPSLVQWQCTDPSIPEPVEKEKDGLSLLIREIEEFPAIPSTTPSLSLVNNLYIYPQQVNLSSRPGRCRNITCLVEVYDTDDISALPLKCLYGSCVQPTLTSRRFTRTSYHNAQPYMDDEIKIALPINLTPNHHIRFTFFHIGTSRAQTGPVEPAETIVGFAILPLLVAPPSLQIAPPDQNLAVFMKLESGYLKKVNSTALDSGRGLFRLSVKLHSSLFTQNPTLGQLFEDNTQKDSEIRLTSVLPALLTVDAPLLIHHFPLILDILLDIIAGASSGSCGLAAFNALVTVIRRVVNHTSSAMLVRTYLEHVYAHKHIREPLYLRLCEYWVFALEMGAVAGSKDDVLMFSWFIFELITRCMTLFLHEHGLLEMEDGDRTGRFPSGLHVVLRKLLTVIIREIRATVVTKHSVSKQVHTNLTIFVRQLFAIYDRGLVLDLIHVCMDETTQNNGPVDDNLYRFKTSFIQTVCDYEHFVQLNIPVSHTQEDIVAMTRGRYEGHDLICLFCSHVLSCLTHKNETICVQALSALRSLLAKHANDERYQEYRVKQRIIGMYMPFVMMMIQQVTTIKEWAIRAPKSSQRLLMTSFLYILQTVDRDELKIWWKTDVPSRVLALISLLSLAAKCFEYDADILKDAHENRITQMSNDAKQAVEAIYNGLEARLRGSVSETNGSSIASSISVASVPSTPTEGRTSPGFPLASPRPIMAIMTAPDALSVPNSTPVVPPLPLTTVLSRGDLGSKEKTPRPETKDGTVPTTPRGGKDTNKESKDSKKELRAHAKLMKPLSKSLGPSMLHTISSAKVSKEDLQRIGNASTAVMSLIIELISELMSDLVSTDIAVDTDLLGRSSGSPKPSPVIGTPSAPIRSPAFTPKLRFPSSSSLSKTARQSSESGKQSLLWMATRHSMIRSSPIASQRHTTKTNPSALVGIERAPAQNELLQHVFSLLMQLLQEEQSGDLCQYLVSYLRSFALQFRPTIFAGNDFAAGLCKELVRLCANRVPATRSAVTLMLYLLLRHNIRELHHVWTVKVHATVALSDLVASGAVKDSKQLLQSFNLLNSYAMREFSLPESQSLLPTAIEDVQVVFAREVQQLGQRLTGVLNSALTVTRAATADPDITAELYCTVIAGYSHTPELQMSWLRNLSLEYEKRGCLVEAAYCMVQVAAMILEYLQLHDPYFIPENLFSYPQPGDIVRKDYRGTAAAVFRNIFPTLHLDTEFDITNEALATSQQFTEPQFLYALITATDYLQKAEMHESAYALCRYLAAMFENLGDQRYLLDIHRTMSQITESILNSGDPMQRLCGSFYRIGYYGKVFGPNDGKEFVYRENRFTHLIDVTKRLKAMYNDIEIIQHSRLVDRSTFEEDRNGVQITAVVPYLTEEERKGSWLQRNSNISMCFIFPSTV